ncbi:AAA-like domain-containing protein [Lachnospiraceae bacterium C1.1]|nr:AAA-like domain-containing protein [Lachnospiraceae bacterium C1.1]
MKRFNTTSICIPEKHYMVDLSERVREIKRFVDDGKYFMINRARQYGKTTTLVELKKALSAEYDVLFLDFQNIGKSGYSSEKIFVQEFCRILWNRRKIDSAEMDSIIYDIEKWKDSEKPRVRLGELFDTLIKWCENAKRDIVLIIDEVDTAANYQVFLDFLAQLREKYISRDRDGIKTFKSVILAGVTDKSPAESWRCICY